MQAWTAWSLQHMTCLFWGQIKHARSFRIILDIVLSVSRLTYTLPLNQLYNISFGGMEDIIPLKSALFARKDEVYDPTLAMPTVCAPCPGKKYASFGA